MSATRITPGAALTESRVRLNRTCTACRQRKIKCTPLAQELDAGNTDACTRCWKHSLSCVFPPSARKKTRRRNEEKIRDLESRLDAVQAAVGAGLGLQSPPEQVTTSSLPALNEAPAQKHSAESLDAAPGDPVIDDFLSPELAGKLYRTFTDSLASLYPLVSVPNSETWLSTRRDRPALFKAMITAASMSSSPEISAKMFHETAQFLAEKVVVAGEKSLDLIQALLVLSTWHLPPSTFGELKFSQYAHMAATMVTDLRSSNDRRYAMPTASDTSPPSHELAEMCRTFLAAYFLCSSMAMSYRRPTSLFYGPWVEDCVRILQLSPGAHLNDLRLVQWIKLHRIAEESLSAASADGEWPVDFSDARTPFILKVCLQRLETWRQSTPAEIINSTLEMHYQTIRIMLHEPALYDGHNISDFRPPYALRSYPLSQQSRAEVGTQAANSHMQCILSSQALIRTFLDLPVETLLFMPVITYTRVAYAVIVLIKCFVSVRAYTRPGEILFKASLDPASALPQLINNLESVIDQPEGRLPVPTVFHSVLSEVHKWYHRSFTMNTGQDAEDLMEPMMHLSLGGDKIIGHGELDRRTSTAGQSSEVGNDLMLQEGLFGCEGFELIGATLFDSLVTDPWVERPDSSDCVDLSFA